MARAEAGAESRGQARGARPGAGTLAAFMVLAVAAMVIVAALVPMPRAGLPPRDGPALREARTWGYQLQQMDPAKVPDSVDVLVTDYSRDGSHAAAWTPADVAGLRRRSDGRPRIVLSYISIGEAETYRYYWRSHWANLPPAWLGRENPEWKGNFPVRFWQPGWASTLLEPKPSALSRLLAVQLPWWGPYLDRIIEAGFDGIYLDRVDVYYEWEAERKTARAEMIAFVAALSAYAKARRPGFLIVPQNAEELLASPEYRRTIDGIAKEDLWFGVDGDGKRNSEVDVAASLAMLSEAQADRLPVFVVEYLADEDQRAEVQRQAMRQGFVLVVARRPLDAPPEPLPAVPNEPATAVPPTSSGSQR